MAKDKEFQETKTAVEMYNGGCAVNLKKKGKMSQSTIDKWEEETGGKILPKRVKKKKKSPKKKTKTQTRRR